MKTRLSITLIAVAIMLSCSCSRHDSHGALTEAVDSLFESMFYKDDPGAVVLIAKGDTIIYERGFGMARLDSAAKITPQTLFNVCSISKQFAAVALLMLQEQGLVNLDDSIPAYFPELKQPFYNTVTLRHMLSHTSGIPDSRPRTEQEWQAYRQNNTSIYNNVEDFKRYALVAESTRYLTTLDSLSFRPGTAFEYINTTYQLVLPLVERVTYSRFTDWMYDNIFEPAGMTSTVFFDPTSRLQNYAHGYTRAVGPNKNGYFRSANGRWEECDYGEANFFPTKADGGLYSTAEDFLRWERALFGGKIISKSSLEQATFPYMASDAPHAAYGLGLYIENMPDKPRKIYHHGDNGGFLTYEVYFPEEDIFYLIFANRPDWDRDATVAAMDSILARTEF